MIAHRAPTVTAPEGAEFARETRQPEAGPVMSPQSASSAPLVCEALPALIAELVEHLRKIVTALGDVPEAWDLAEIAAALERLRFALEA